MIIYNVTIKVETSVAKEWEKWMKETHIPDLMNTNLFVDARLCHLLEQDENEDVTYSVQYFCESMEHYNNYISQHASAMRDKSFKRFGNKFLAFRTIMEVIS